MSPSIRVTDTAPGVRHIVLDDPRRANPVGPDFVDAVGDAVSDSSCAAVAVTAAGEGVFCGGGDLALGPAGLSSLSRQLYELYGAIVASPTVLVVGVNGIAVGAGAQLVLAADLRYAGPRFRIRVADLRTGLVAGMWALSADVGRCRATTMLLCGDELDAAQAVTWGLVTETVSDATAAALAAAQRASRIPEDVRRRVKASVALASLSPSALQSEADSFTPPDLVIGG